MADIELSGDGVRNSSVTIAQVIYGLHTLSILIGITSAVTIVGAFVLSTLTTTVYNFGIPANENLVFEAPVVIAVCLLQSSKTGDLWQRWRRSSQLRAKGIPA